MSANIYEQKNLTSLVDIFRKYTTLRHFRSGTDLTTILILYCSYCPYCSVVLLQGWGDLFEKVGG